MPKLIKNILQERVERWWVWIFPSQKKLLKKEVEKSNGKWENESQLMRHIINQWFIK